jgi:hypothetical protein
MVVFPNLLASRGGELGRRLFICMFEFALVVRNGLSAANAIFG